MQYPLPSFQRILPLFLVTLLLFTSSAYAQFAFDENLLSMSGNANRVKTADLNGDGAPDIVAVITYADLFNDGQSVVVFLNDGLGSFLPGRQFRTGVQPSSVDLADIDQDGDLDLAVTNAADDTVSVLFNNGMGGFTNRQTYGLAGGQNPRDLVFMDWDNDGDQDIFVINNLGAYFLTLLINNGDARYTEVKPLDIGSFSVAGATTDFNLDGAQDLVIASLGYDTVHVLLGDGDGEIARHLELPTRINPFDINTADFNNDGTSDLVVGLQEGIVFYRNDGLANFKFVTLYRLDGNTPYEVETVDINNNGIKDYAVVVAYTDSGLSILQGKNRPKGGPVADRVHFTTEPNPNDVSLPLSIASADFNGDGAVDFVMSDYVIPGLRIYYNRTVSTPLIGAVSGIRTRSVSCKNITTGHTVVLSGARARYNCEAAGLTTRVGDTVVIHIAGQVIDPELAGGTTRGISDKRRVSCAIPGNTQSDFSMHEQWLCADLGLSLSAGDSVNLTASGVVR